MFCQFFLLRVADEFKDAAIDARFRPERPVPSGLVTLEELRRLGIGAAVLQLLCVLAIDIRLVPLLGAIWLWFALMSVEFFAGGWLRLRPAFYMASHMMIMPLLALFAMAAAAPEGSNRLPALLASAGVWVFCALSLAGGILLETGRKIRTREQERPGVETYTALWGAPLAVGVWLSAACAAAILALWTAALLGTPWPTGVAAGAGLAAASVLAMLRLKRPRPVFSSVFELFSGLWVMALMFMLALAGL
ncbi:MAG: UbiA family prenyltransferase [Alphaproteobacteria bacterium]